MLPLPRPINIRRKLPEKRKYEHTFHSSRDNAIPKPNFASVLLAQKLRKESKSQSSRSLYHEQPRDNIYEVRITFLSNYGDPNRIRCSAFGFFQKNDIVMKVYKCRMDTSHAIQPLSNMFQGQLVKDSESEDWVAPFDGSPIQTTVFVQGTEPPEYIRAWNSRFYPNENAKEITIHVGGQFANRICLPIQFGVNISTKINQTFLLPLKVIGEPRMRKGLFGNDLYGEMPTRGFNEIRLEITEFDMTSNVCGLNHIEIIGANGKKLILGSEIKSVVSEGCTDITSPALLLKKDKKTSDFTQMWCATREADVVSLIFKLDPLVGISAIRIYNHNANEQENRCCVKRGRVLCDGDCVWRGKIREADGIAIDVSKYATNVFISDLPIKKGGKTIFDIEQHETKTSSRKRK